MKTVCWFKHGPYEDNEPLQVVFEDPNDTDCYSALVSREVAEERITDLESKLRDANLAVERLQSIVHDLESHQ